MSIQNVFLSMAEPAKSHKSDVSFSIQEDILAANIRVSDVLGVYVLHSVC
jgi:hypothetical protein